jgi:hypothetical protein
VFGTIFTIAAAEGAVVSETMTVSLVVSAAVVVHEIMAFGDESRVAPVNDTETGVTVAVGVPAEAGVTEDRRPNPIADTATSAMRLRSVFVDICFLSISRVREFPDLGFG